MNTESIIPVIPFAPGFESAVAENLSRLGVVKVAGCLDDTRLHKLNQEYEEILNYDGAGVRDLGLNAGKACDLTRFDLPEGLFSETVGFYTQEWMQRISDHYWSEVRTLNDHIFVTREVTGTTHLAQDLHFDVQETLKFFLYLNDVTRKNGAFSCVPGSVSLTKEKRIELGDEVSYEKRDLSREHPFDESDVVAVEAPAGTLIIFTTEVWHRAGRVSEGERRIMRGHTREKEKLAREPKRRRLHESQKGNRFVRGLKSLIRR